jgi:cation transport protein ChaC
MDARMIIDGYVPMFLPIGTPQGPLEALTFVVNKANRRYCSLDEEATARAIASAKGLLGSNLAYLDSLHEHLTLLGIADPDIARLHERAHEIAAEMRIPH